MATDEDLMGAEVYEFRNQAINPRTPPDPRFDPANDAENAAAHAAHPTGADADPMDDEELYNTVRDTLRAARDYMEEELEPRMVAATDYYYGRPFGNEKEGRSQVVNTVVRDATMSQIPSLMRTLFSPHRVAEVVPKRPDQEGMARQQTEEANFVITQDNHGFRAIQNAVSDALVRGNGFVKYWYDTKNRVSESTYTGLNLQQASMLLSSPGVEVVEYRQYDNPEFAGQMDAFAPQGVPQVYDVRIRRVEQEGQIRLAAIPPEEVLFLPTTRDFENAPVVAHSRLVPMEDLVAEGYDPDDLEDHLYTGAADYGSDDMTFARQITADNFNGRGEFLNDQVDSSQQLILFTEAYILMDVDGDGISELRRFDCVGRDYECLNKPGEVVDEVPISVWIAHMEPHTVVGLSNFDLLGEVQLVSSQLHRGFLDSMAESLDSTTEVVQGEVNLSDLLNPERGKIVRVRRPGMMREVPHKFVGGDVLPAVQLWDEVKENRTGTSKAAMGLDADALQSTTKAAVAATMSGSQQRLEMIARTLAETGLRGLVRGVIRLLAKHRMTRYRKLGGQWELIDPTEWDLGLDIKINIGLGQGTPEDQLVRVQSILQLQAQAIEMGAPFISPVEIRKGFAKYVELAGFRAEDFVAPWTAEQQQQLEQQQAMEPTPPDPNALIAQAELQKAQDNATSNNAKHDLEVWKARKEDERERMKIERDFEIKLEDLKVKAAKVQADIDREAKSRRDVKGGSE